MNEILALYLVSLNSSVCFAHLPHAPGTQRPPVLVDTTLNSPLWVPMAMAPGDDCTHTPERQLKQEFCRGGAVLFGLHRSFLLTTSLSATQNTVLVGQPARKPA